MRDEHAPWTSYEREALNDVLKDQQLSIRRLEIELAVVKTKISIVAAFCGVAGAAAVEIGKLLIHQ